MADELEQNLNNAAEGQEITQPQEPAENTENTESKPQTIQSLLDQKGNQEEIQELWKQSNNFKQGLWKTPDDIFKSVQFYEKKFQPLEMTMKNMGFEEPSQLEQAFKSYQENLPVYQENQNLIDTLNALLQNETYGSKLRNVFDEIRRAQETEKFGIAFDDLPPVIKERVTKGEQAFQELEEMKKEQAYNSALSTIQDQMAQIEQIVADTGLEFDKQAFLEYCRDNNIAPSNMKGEFLNSNYTQMLEKAKQSASLATTAQNRQNKTKALNSSTKTVAQAPAPKIKDEYDLKKTLLSLD